MLLLLLSGIHFNCCGQVRVVQLRASAASGLTELHCWQQDCHSMPSTACTGRWQHMQVRPGTG